MKKLMYSVLAVFLSFSSCGGNKKAESASQDGTKPFVITMLNVYFAAEPPPVDHEIYKMIESEAEAVFDQTWVPSAGFSEKITLTLASDDMPMVINGKELSRSPNMLDAQRHGIFWELTDRILSQCTRGLNSLDPNINKILSVDGKLYCLYQERPLGRSGMYYRSDWLKKLGLPEPRTISQLDQIVRAFATQDPDGNGKNDTYGIFIREVQGNTSLPNWLCAANGGSNTWEEKDGKFTPTFVTQPYINGITLMRSWYKDKILNQDFVALKATQDVQDAFMAQRSGFNFPDSIDDAFKLEGVYQLDPNATLAVQSTMIDINGKEVCTPTTGHSGAFFFPKKSIKSEDTLVKVLKVFDVINDRKGDIFFAMVWGLRDRHYTLDEQGRVNQNQAQKELRSREINNFVQLRVFYDQWAYDPDRVVVSQLQADIFNEWLKSAAVAVIDPTLPLVSDTWVERGNQLENIRKDTVSKYIMGVIDLDGYKKEIKNWLDSGGTKVIEEYEEEFKKTL